MAPYTTYFVRKLILRFLQRRKTQREFTDLTETGKSSVNRTIVSFKKLAGKGLNYVQGDDPKLMKDQFEI